MKSTSSLEKHPTRLRDFGAFDIAQLPTRKIAVQPGKLLAYAQPHRPDLTLPSPAPVPSEPSPCYSTRSKIFSVLTAILHNRWLKAGTRLTITVAFFFVLSTSISWSSVFTTLSHIHRGMLLVAFVTGSGGLVLSAYQWRSLLRAVSIRCDLADLVNLYVVGVAFSHLLPTGMGGDVVKAMYAAGDSRNHTGSTGATLMCRITGFAGMLVIAFPVWILRHQHLDPRLSTWFLILCALVGGSIGALLLLSVFVPALLTQKWSRIPARQPLLRFSQVLRYFLRRPRTLSIAVGYGIIFWAIAILNCYCYAHALGIEAALDFYCIAVPFVSLMSFLPISINGFGLRESAYVYTFATIGIGSASSLSLALLLDLQALIFAVLGWGIYLTFTHRPSLTLSMPVVTHKRWL